MPCISGLVGVGDGLESFDGVDDLRIGDFVGFVDGTEGACAEKVGELDGAFVNESASKGQVGRAIVWHVGGTLRLEDDGEGGLDRIGRR